MTWIKTIDYSEADTKLKRIYNRVSGPNSKIDNVLKIHSLRPHSLVGHMTLYKSVLHNSNNKLPKSLLESIGIYVSYLNGCNYCVEHHLAGLMRLLRNDPKVESFMTAIQNGTLREHLDIGPYEALMYARKLTMDIENIGEGDLVELREAGYSDGEILEINQVASYFNYVNRTVLGLGVNTQGDELGLSPNESDDPKNWNHS